MAEIIRVVFEGNDDGSPLAKSTPSQQASGGGNLKSAYETFSAARKVLAAVGATQIADSVINYRISTIALRTGETEHQQRVQFVYGEASQAVGSLGAIVGGLSLGGPVGALVVAGGVAVSYALKFIGWAQNANTLRLQKSVEDVSIQMQTIRAGLPRRWEEND